MLASINSLGIEGIDGYKVCVEVDISGGLPNFSVVGLPDAAVMESRERVRAAIKNSEFEFPNGRITANLAPADLRKEGSVYDLPLAIGILAANGCLTDVNLEKTVLIGELSLAGDVSSITGVLPMAISAMQQGFDRIILPADNSQEAACVEGITVIGVKDLRQVVDFLRGNTDISPTKVLPWRSEQAQESGMDMSLVRGQFFAKRALEVAAAGGHNVIMIGPPGSGKTMLARCIPTILPDMTFEETLEVSKIHSLRGGLPDGKLLTSRPFRAPHHTSSMVSLTGGGQKLRPGEISLAHYGVLFLDELTEFQRNTLEALRQPLEDGFVTLSRASGTAIFPSNVMLIASMNPCPCGNYGSRMRECSCTPMQVSKYLNRISQPMLDRIDIQLSVDAVSYSDLSGQRDGETSAEIKARVNRARQIQLDRFAHRNIHFNSQMNAADINEYCLLDENSKKMMKQVFEQLKLSARAYNRILKMARTIADMAGSINIAQEHLAEAVQYRSLDRKYWRV